jgi:hypothetical protein
MKGESSYLSINLEYKQIKLINQKTESDQIDLKAKTAKCCLLEIHYTGKDPFKLKAKSW